MTHVVSKIPFILVFFSLFLLLLFLCTRGVVYSDEGYILNGAERILSGEVPYKDFHFAYTPLSLYITATAFLIFGKSILAGRILMIVFSLLTSFVLFLLFEKISKNVYISFLGIFLYIVWAPLHINFPWPVLFALSFGIFSIYFLFEGIQRQESKFIVLSGFFTFLVFLAKQNFGAVMLLNFGIAILFIPSLQKKRLFLIYTLGLLILVVFYGLYLIITGSFTGFFGDFYIYTIQRIILDNTLTTPFIYGNTIVLKTAKLIFYLTPLVLGGGAIILCFFKNKQLLFLPLFVSLFYIVGIRPTTDYVHLSPLLSLIGIPLVILWKTIKKKFFRVSIVLVSVFFIVIGMYSAVFVGYYRWEPSLVVQNKFLSLPKTGIFTESFHKDELEKLVLLINKKIKPTDAIFVNEYAPMLYFVTDRKNPTGFDLIESTDFYTQYEESIINILRNRHVKIIITKGNPGKGYLGEFIKKEYNKTDVINNFSIWEKIYD